MTQRRRLDAFLVEQAAAAGAEVRDGIRVEELDIDEPESPRGSAASRWGRRARRSGWCERRRGPLGRAGGGDRAGRGARGERAARGARRRLERTAVIELAVLPRRLRLGVPEGRPREPRRRRLGRRGAAAARPPRAARPRTRSRGRAVPTYEATDSRCAGSARPRAGRVLLVGDAAGLVDPLSGDGMYEAFVSARLAADAIVAGRARGLYRGALGGARPARRRLLGREARLRPLSAHRVRRGPRAGRLQGGRRPALRRRRPPGGRPGRGPGAAEADRAPRRLTTAHSSASASARSEVAYAFHARSSSERSSVSDSRAPRRPATSPASDSSPARS